MQVIVVGGPAGTGKSTLAEKLAEKLKCPFTEGDSLHPQANIDKMSNGIPLTDDDRWGWLEKLSQTATKSALDPKNNTHTSIVSCSMLKKVYRKHIIEKAKDVSGGHDVKFTFVFLYTTLEELFKRVESRSGHYMKSDMVISQYEIMEIPKGEELISNGGSCLAVDTTGKDAETVFEEVALQF